MILHHSKKVSFRAFHLYSHLEHCVPFWAPHCKKNTDFVELVLCRAQRSFKDWSISLMRRDWESWDHSAQGDLIHPMGGNEEERVRLCSVVPTDRTRGSGHRLKKVKFYLNIRRPFLLWGWPSTGTGWLEKMWSLSTEITNTWLDMVLRNLLLLSLLEQGGGTGRSPEVPSSHNHSMILCDAIL